MKYLPNYIVVLTTETSLIIPHPRILKVTVTDENRNGAEFRSPDAYYPPTLSSSIHLITLSYGNRYIPVNYLTAGRSIS